MLPSGSLRLKFQPGLRLSDEAFWKLSCANPDLRLERTLTGELVVMAPAGSNSGRRASSLNGQLWSWNQQDGLGVTFDSEAAFTLPNTAIRGPDAAWISLERWQAVPEDDRERFAHVCPDFVAEIRSRTDRLSELRAKMREYREQGVRLGWLIDPRRNRVEIYRPGRPTRILPQPLSVSGEDVLPGFVLDLKGILFD